MIHLLERDFKSISFAQPRDVERLVELNIILTGASGFVGKWFVGAWLAGCDLFGGKGRLMLTCRNPTKLLDEFPVLIGNPRVEIVQADIRSFRLNPSFRPSVLIHAATEASERLNVENPFEMIDVIVSGTKNLLQQIEGTGVGRFIYLSSGAVYGKRLDIETRMEESDLTGPELSDPRNAYHEAKRLAELMIAVASSRGVTQTVVLRLFTFLAPYLPLTAHFAAGNFVLQTLLGNDIQIKSDGSSIRSYQYGSDLIRFIVALSVRNTKQPIYNIGSPDPISIFELATTIKNTLNSKSRIIVHGTRGPNEFSVYVPNTRLVEHELGMTSEISLSEGILKTAEWAKTVQIAKSST